MKFDTISVYGGYSPDPTTNSRAVPLYMTNAYTFDSTEDARRIFALEQPGNIYSRLGTPTCAVLERRVAALEGGVGGLSASSGHGAMVMAFVNLCSGAGDEIVASKRIYGGAINMMDKTMRQLGVNFHFADADTPEEFARATNEKTRGYFIETLGNPSADIPDIEKIAELAHRNGLPLVADNTAATPYLMRPIEHGADIVLHSVSKYLVGNGTIMGGLVVDSGNFVWKGNPRFPAMNKPDESYHGVVYADMGNTAFITKLRTHVLRDVGACLSPFNAWVALTGVETLSLRMEKHCKNALAVAEYLESHPKISFVSYPGLKSSKYYPLAEKYLPKGQSSMFTFEINGGREEAAKFCDSLKMISIVTNLGDVRTIVSCPAATTHSQLSDAQLSEAGILPGTIRVSVGLEDIEDIIGDIRQALDAV
jgi:O-acetylhomoserine (thiol)-lyase